MIYTIDQIRHVHLEISSLCNAACPLCPRNVFGYPYNYGYTEHNMTVDEAKIIFKPDFIKQINKVIINGNFGDAIMNPDTVPIIDYFRQHNADMVINISTNGGARNKIFWQDLAALNVEVSFCIDGTDNNTHALYRRNTLYSTVIRNAQTFIDAGGYAIWKMIKFDHNQHQIDTARDLSLALKFAAFLLVDDGRNSGPVYNKDGDLEYVIGPEKLGYEPTSRAENIVLVNTDKKYKSQQIFWINKVVPREINCEVSHTRSIYISSTGDVFPCCYIGLSPATYRNNSDVGYSMEQVNAIMYNNSALTHSLEECIKWFDKIEESWSKPDIDSGRLVTCNQSCGGKLRIDTFHVHNAEYTYNKG